MKNTHLFTNVASVLLLIGGLAWGLIGLFQLDLITSIVGEGLARVIFVLVGIAAIYRIFEWARKK
jgi:hypothetical protein